jgi:SAM-dependent methyltransferase
MVTIESLAEAGWTWSTQALAGLSAYERTFIETEFLPPRTLDYYLARLDYLGLTQGARVLDAGCGMGQWSIALSRRFRDVDGIDSDSRRISLAQALAANMQARNCAFRAGELETLPYPDEHFDAVFCYGVLMFTHMPSSLREFRRVLNPNGRFYLNANSWGWYAHLLKDVPRNRLPALRFIRNTMLARNQRIVVTEPWLRRALASAGLSPLQIDVEGACTFQQHPRSDPPAPAYRARYLGMRAVIEAIGFRN